MYKKLGIHDICYINYYVNFQLITPILVYFMKIENKKSETHY